MRIFLDTANIDQIKQGVKLGIVSGVTTNPTLMSREKMPYRQLLTEICKVVSGPVSAEVVALDSPGMVKEGEDLASIADNITIKIPTTIEGLKAIRVLTEKGIMTNATLCFSSMQALLVAKAGATFVSPFVGRLDDISHEGMDLVDQILVIFDNYGFDIEVIVASIRHPLHVVEAALVGADIVTVPFTVLEKIIKHPLTDIGLEKFLKDWGKVKR